MTPKLYYHVINTGALNRSSIAVRKVLETVVSHLNAKNFKAEMEQTPFHVAFVFGVNEDALRAWCL